MNKHIYRKYDIRGVVGVDLTEEAVTLLAKAIGTFFVNHGVKTASIGYDARESSPRFCDILNKEISGCGVDVVEIGAVPTPLLYFSLFTENVDAGVMITGSHNPKDYNGFKICLNKSTIYGDKIQEIRSIAESGQFASGAGRIEEKDIVPEYIRFVKENISMGDRRIKVVVDSGNGSAGVIGVPLYRELGCEVVELYTEPDSDFPNHHPDPTVAENLADAIQVVEDSSADLAVAFDGDGDRIGVVDENGRIIWGDELLIIFSREILSRVPGAAFIGEVKCSQRLFEDVRANGGRITMWKVGHSLIKAKMKEIEASLAGEMSGHIFFADRFFGFDDAIYAGARLIEILSCSKRRLSEYLADVPVSASTPELRIDCPDDIKFQVVERIVEEFSRDRPVNDIDGARIQFGDGWGLVRASNTQPSLVLRFEAGNIGRVETLQALVEKEVVKQIRSLRSK